MLCVLSAPSAIAADLDWQIVSGMSTEYLQRQVQRMAADGYRVQAIVADTAQPTIVVVREGGGLFRRRVPASAEYRVLDPGGAAGIPALGAAGFRLRATGKARIGPALAIVERLLAGQTPHDYRSVQAAPAAPLEPLLTPVAVDGYRVIASVGDSGSEWVIVEREADSGGAREARAITASDVDDLEARIDALASQGFGCDAAWNRPPKGVALFKGGTLMAALSRRRGSTSPAAHVKTEIGERPSESGQLLSVVPYRNRFAFVIRRSGSSDYSVKEATFPSRDEQRSSSVIADPILERLRSQWWNPIELAWAVTAAGEVKSWVGLERRKPTSLFSSASTVARKEAGTIGVPAGAAALPPGGGEPGDTYRAHLNAIVRRDLVGAKRLWTGRQRAAWDENVKRMKGPLGTGFSEKDLFKSMAERTATDQTVARRLDRRRPRHDPHRRHL